MFPARSIKAYMAWAMAVAAATAIPNGVSDFLDQALYTRAAVAGTAMRGFMDAIIEGLKLLPVDALGRASEVRRRPSQNLCCVI